MNGMNKLNREIFFKKQEEKAVKKVLIRKMRFDWPFLNSIAFSIRHSDGVNFSGRQTSLCLTPVPLPPLNAAKKKLWPAVNKPIQW